MKKHVILSVLTLGIIFLTDPTFAIAKTTARIASTSGLRMRSGPGTSYEKLITVPYNSRVTIQSYQKAGEGCSDQWAEIIYEDIASSYKGYVCSTYFEDIETTEDKEDEPIVVPPTDVSDSEMAKMTEEEFEAYLNSQGFPESYKVKLRVLHQLHPTWVFKGVKSKYSWGSALYEQNQSGTSLFNVNSSMKANGYEGYLSTEAGNYDYATDTFVAHDGMYWYQANEQAIAYYMDPRNFLDEKNIFMFEDLLYSPQYQTINTIQKILTSDFMKKYSDYFLEAAVKHNVSPMYLAALSRQEVGLQDTNIVTNGKAGVLEDGIDYTGYYNFFNIGASSSPNPKLKSLQTAKQRNWNSPQKSIVEGAYSIAVNYVLCGQYTSYFQKFNLAPTATKGIWHQYTTNIAALSSPAYTTYQSYKGMGIIDEEFSFSIPIFDNMPEATSLPRLGNPNNWLKELKVGGNSVTNFYGGTSEYTVTVPYTESIAIEATTVNDRSSIIGVGTKELENDETAFSIVVTAQNGVAKTYTVTIRREKKQEDNPEQHIKVADVLQGSGLHYDESYVWNILLSTDVEGLINQLTKSYQTASVNIQNKQGQTKNEGTIVTGDRVIVSINGESKTLEVILYGDVNGDGVISVSDILNIQKHILQYTTLLGPYVKAGDINRDGKISVSDILHIQKQILGYSNISQE